MCIYINIYIHIYIYIERSPGHSPDHSLKPPSWPLHDTVITNRIRCIL